MKKNLITIILCLSLAYLSGCAVPGFSETGTYLENPAVKEHPPMMDLGRGKLKFIPEYNQEDIRDFQVDLRSYDLSPLNLKQKAEQLFRADFDTRTIWPDRLPRGFDPKKFIRLGKDPGLGIREIHDQGITGQGVGVAIIDGSLLVDHKEYKERLKLYEHIHCLDKTASVDGCAAASIAVGKTTGVAPGASLYYIAQAENTTENRSEKKDLTWLAQAIQRVAGLNTTLPAKDKIRVLSIAFNWTDQDEAFDDLMQAVEAARSQGIFVLSPSIQRIYGDRFYFYGLGRDAESDPNRFSSYKPGKAWENAFYLFEPEISITDALYIPTDARSCAAPTGQGDYAYYPTGDWSECTSYLAGLYALCCQVRPDLTPELFWQKALETGETLQLRKSYFKRELRKIPNPDKLIEQLKKGN